MNNIYNERVQINKEMKALKQQLKATEDRLLTLQKKCSHKIVLVFDDHLPHKIGRIIDCFCPACGKRENLYPNDDIKKTVFKNSKLIDLTKLPISTLNENFFSILEHIFGNYDFYYNDDVPENEIAESILGIVEKKEDEQQMIRKNIPNERKDD